MFPGHVFIDRLRKDLGCGSSLVTAPLHPWSDPDEENDSTQQDGQEAGDDDDDDDVYHARWAQLLIGQMKGGQRYCSSCRTWQLWGIVIHHHQSGAFALGAKIIERGFVDFCVNTPVDSCVLYGQVTDGDGQLVHRSLSRHSVPVAFPGGQLGATLVVIQHLPVPVQPNIQVHSVLVF